MQRPFHDADWKIGFFFGAICSITILLLAGVEDSFARYCSVSLSLVAQMGLVLSFFRREFMRFEKLLMDRGCSVGELPLRREKLIGNLAASIGVVVFLTGGAYGFPEDFGVLLFSGVWGISITIGAVFYIGFAQVSKILTTLNLDQTTGQPEPPEKRTE